MFHVNTFNIKAFFQLMMLVEAQTFYFKMMSFFLLSC